LAIYTFAASANPIRPGINFAFQLTTEQVNYNARTYAEQAYKILDRKKTQVHFNAEWLAELCFTSVIKAGPNFTIQQFMTRGTSVNRGNNGDAIIA